MNFKLNPKTKDWEAQVVVGGRLVRLSIDASCKESDRITNATQAVKTVQTSAKQLEQNLITSLFKLYNDTWADPEEGYPVLTEAQFLSKITLRSIEVGEEEALTLYFKDGDLFGGHSIEIFWYQGKMHKAQLVG